MLGKFNVRNVLAVLRGATILRMKADKVGKWSRLHGRVSIKNSGTLRIGRNVSMTSRPMPSQVVVNEGAVLEIGDNVFMNCGLDIGCTARISIGDNTIIGPLVNIIDCNYHPVDASKPTTSQAITIEENVWIGRGVTILPGITIGRGSVVAAGSVVTKSIPERVLAGGVPAAIIRELDIPPDWIRRNQ
jgi:Acetyltransferase (isoleucine patch superfamily)